MTQIKNYRINTSILCHGICDDIILKSCVSHKYHLLLPLHYIASRLLCFIYVFTCAYRLTFCHRRRCRGRCFDCWFFVLFFSTFCHFGVSFLLLFDKLTNVLSVRIATLCKWRRRLILWIHRSHIALVVRQFIFRHFIRMIMIGYRLKWNGLCEWNERGKGEQADGMCERDKA